jgi:hypothetical protein
MMRLILLISLFGICWAEPVLSLSQFQKLEYLSASEDKLKISDQTKRIIISFDQEGNGFMSAFLQTKPASYLPSEQTIYIGDISNMPTLVTRLFAKPRMQEYPFKIYLHEDSKLQSWVPNKPNKVTVILFNEEGKSEDIFFTNIPQQALGIIKK